MPQQHWLRWGTVAGGDGREGAYFRLIYVPVDRATQHERIEQRWRQAPEQTFPMAVADLDRWRGQFQIPEAEELTCGRSDAPPTPWADWFGWAEDRWPSLWVG